MKEEQGKKMDAKDLVIPAMPVALSDEDLDAVAGGGNTSSLKQVPMTKGKLPNPTDSSESIFDRWGNM